MSYIHPMPDTGCHPHLAGSARERALLDRRDLPQQELFSVAELWLLADIVAHRIEWARMALRDPTLRGREAEDLRVARALVMALQHVTSQITLPVLEAYSLTCVLTWELEIPYFQQWWRSARPDRDLGAKWRVVHKLKTLVWHHRTHPWPVDGRHR